MKKVYTFTKRYDTVSHVLTLPISVKLDGAQSYYETHGIIDTGAIFSVISRNVAIKLGATSLGYQFMATASQEKVVTNLFNGSIILYDQLEISNLTIADGILPEGEECLIGMDILSLGDLAIIHFEGKTCISFRIPSQQSIELKECI